MIINHNIAALNTHRQLSFNNSQASNNLEKLSSGLRINRAGDDAAGLAISEKMRGQIRGLDMAQKNAQDGISLIQTAEGALNETHDILQRMRELAVQSANDTNTDTDRAELQKEVNQLAEEITRIADNTEFNTQNLLGGDFKGTFHIGANKGQNIELEINTMDATALKVAGTEGAELTQTVTTTKGTDDLELADGEYTVTTAENYEGTALVAASVSGGKVEDISHVIVDADGAVKATSTDGKTFKTYVSPADQDTIEFSGKVIDGETVTVAGGASQTVTTKVSVEDSGLTAGEYTITNIENDPVLGDTYKLALTDSGGNIVALGANDADGTAHNTLSGVTHWVDVNDKTNVLLETTANPAFNLGDKITVTGEGIDISSQKSADAAITTIQSAIDTVSAERSKLGAMQNRLEHTINNLGTSSENLTAAESRIRDVDYVLAAA